MNRELNQKMRFIHSMKKENILSANDVIYFLYISISNRNLLENKMKIGNA